MCFAKYGAVTIAELPGRNTTEQMLKYVASSRQEFS